MSKKLKIIELKGAEITPYLEAIARLQMEVFKSYPYLSEANLQDEVDDLQAYSACPHSIMMVVLDQDQVVGASAALPLQFASQHWIAPFAQRQVSVEEIFYFSGSALLPAYRGRNIYRHFFTSREAAAKNYGSKMSAFCAIARPDDDPRKPRNFVPLNPVWQHFGYQQRTELCAYEEWQDKDESVVSRKPLFFWIKHL